MNRKIGMKGVHNTKRTPRPRSRPKSKPKTKPRNKNFLSLQFPEGGIVPEFKSWHYDNTYNDGINEAQLLYCHEIHLMRSTAIQNNTKRNTCFIIWPIELNIFKNTLVGRIFRMFLQLEQIAMQVTYVKNMNNIKYKMHNIVWILDTDKQIFLMKNKRQELGIVQFRIANEYLLVVKYLISLYVDVRFCGFDGRKIGEIHNFFIGLNGDEGLSNSILLDLNEFLQLCRNIHNPTKCKDIHRINAIFIICKFLNMAKSHFIDTFWKSYCSMLSEWIYIILVPDIIKYYFPVGCLDAKRCAGTNNLRIWRSLFKKLNVCKSVAKPSVDKYPPFIINKIQHMLFVAKTMITFHTTAQYKQIMGDCLEFNRGRFLCPSVYIYLCKFNTIKDYENVHPDPYGNQSDNKDRYMEYYVKADEDITKPIVDLEADASDDDDNSSDGSSGSGSNENLFPVYNNNNKRGKRPINHKSVPTVYVLGINCENPYEKERARVLNQPYQYRGQRKHITYGRDIDDDSDDDDDDSDDDDYYYTHNQGQYTQRGLGLFSHQSDHAVYDHQNGYMDLLCLILEHIYYCCELEIMNQNEINFY